MLYGNSSCASTTGIWPLPRSTPAYGGAVVWPFRVPWIASAADIRYCPDWDRRYPALTRRPEPTLRLHPLSSHRYSPNLQPPRRCPSHLGAQAAPVTTRPPRHREAAHRNNPPKPSIRPDLRLSMESGWCVSPSSASLWYPSRHGPKTAHRDRPTCPQEPVSDGGPLGARDLPFHAKGRTHPAQTTARTAQCHSDGRPE